MRRDGSGRPPSAGPATETPPTAKQVNASDATVADACSLAGHLDREGMFVAGYSAGFEAGFEVGAGRVVLGLEHALGGLPDLLGTELLDAVGVDFADRYRQERAERYADPDVPCPQGPDGRPHVKTVVGSNGRLQKIREPHRCSSCTRVAARAENRRRYGCDDFPGMAAMRRRTA